MKYRGFVIEDSGNPYMNEWSFYHPEYYDVEDDFSGDTHKVVPNKWAGSEHTINAAKEHIDQIIAEDEDIRGKWPNE